MNRKSLKKKIINQILYAKAFIWNVILTNKQLRKLETVIKIVKKLRVANSYNNKDINQYHEKLQPPGLLGTEQMTGIAQTRRSAPVLQMPSAALGTRKDGTWIL